MYANAYTNRHRSSIGTNHAPNYPLPLAFPASAGNTTINPFMKFWKGTQHESFDKFAYEPLYARPDGEVGAIATAQDVARDTVMRPDEPSQYTLN